MLRGLNNIKHEKHSKGLAHIFSLLPSLPSFPPSSSCSTPHSLRVLSLCVYVYDCVCVCFCMYACLYVCACIGAHMHTCIVCEHVCVPPGDSPMSSRTVSKPQVEESVLPVQGATAWEACTEGMLGHCSLQRCPHLPWW